MARSPHRSRLAATTFVLDNHEQGDPLGARSSAWVELAIGPRGQAGTDNFSVHVGTPEAVLEAQRHHGSVASEALVLVRDWSWPEIEAALQDVVARCDAGEWRLSVAELQRYFHHEFQDYNEVADRLPVVPMIKAYQAADLHLPSWEPLAGERVCVDIDVTIGVRKQLDDHRYRVTVATPAGLRAARSGFVLADRAVLLIAEFRWPTIAAELEAIVRRCRAMDWAGCRSKLERHFVTAPSDC